MRKLEESPGLAPHESVPCSLMDFLAVRLTMSRVAARLGAAENVPHENPLKTIERRRLSRAARIYDAARVVSFSAAEVNLLSDSEWTAFVDEVKACNGLERRRILHLAYERWHEHAILHGLASHRRYRGLSCLKGRPRAQVFFCLDEREESIRRALEELDPRGRDFQRRGLLRRRSGLSGNRRPAGGGILPRCGQAPARSTGAGKSRRQLHCTRAADGAGSCLDC